MHAFIAISMNENFFFVQNMYPSVFFFEFLNPIYICTYTYIYTSYLRSLSISLFRFLIPCVPCLVQGTLDICLTDLKEKEVK